MPREDELHSKKLVIKPKSNKQIGCKLPLHARRGTHLLSEFQIQSPSSGKSQKHHIDIPTAPIQLESSQDGTESNITNEELLKQSMDLPNDSQSDNQSDSFQESVYLKVKQILFPNNETQEITNEKITLDDNETLNNEDPFYEYKYTQEELEDLNYRESILDHTDLVQGLTLKEYQFKKKIVSREKSSLKEAFQILSELDSFSIKEKKHKSHIRYAKKDPALQYQDLREKLNWGPLFKSKSLQTASNQTNKIQRSVPQQMSIKMDTKNDKQTHFASENLGFLVRPLPATIPAEYKWKTPFYFYNN